MPLILHLIIPTLTLNRIADTRRGNHLNISIMPWITHIRPVETSVTNMISESMEICLSLHKAFTIIVKPNIQAPHHPTTGSHFSDSDPELLTNIPPTSSLAVWASALHTTEPKPRILPKTTLTHGLMVQLNIRSIIRTRLMQNFIIAASFPIFLCVALL